MPRCIFRISDARMGTIVGRLSFCNRHDSVEGLLTGVILSMAGATFPTNFPEIMGRVADVEDMLRVSTDQLHRVQAHVPQKFVRTGSGRKTELLLGLVEKDAARRKKVLIFSNKTRTSDFVSHFLAENNVPCVNFNSGVDWRWRHTQLNKFVSGEVGVMSATDLASRGLDTNNVHHVINFDFPLNMADYIHR